MSAPMLTDKRIALLRGGRSSERAVSLDSGAAIERALRNNGCVVEVFDPVDRDWFARLPASNPDCVFIALHGGEGENGAIQGMLEAMDLLYTGSGVLASALAMDKQLCKEIWLSRGMPTARFAMLDAQCDFAAVIDELGSVMVKPVREGSSVGMQRADNAQQLQEACREASRYDSAVMAEQWLSGAEYTVSFVGGRALPVIEVVPATEFYDYFAKYQADTTQYHCPADLDAADTAAITALAEQAYQGLGCRDWGRVDVMRDASGQFQLLEVNTTPGMTSHSLVPMAAKAVGMSFDALVAAITGAALARGEFAA